MKHLLIYDFLDCKNKNIIDFTKNTTNEKINEKFNKQNYNISNQKYNNK